MVQYKPVKVIIDISNQAEVINDVNIHHHELPESIVSDQVLVLISKFWSFLCYFLGIKKRLSTALHP